MTHIIIEPNVSIPMRDGTVLCGDVYRPDTPGKKPVVITRIPYDKTVPKAFLYLDPIRMAKNGYAVVLQDCRGTMSSAGEFYPYRNEPLDGYDTVEWAAAQPWSDGKVGMYGISYYGATQWMAAK